MALAVVGAMMLTVCGGGSGTVASQAAGGNDGVPASEQTFNLKLGHRLVEDHAVHIQMTAWAEAMKEKPNGIINVQILPNDQLGSEADSVSFIQAGALDMARVSTSTLGNSNEAWNVLSVPYVFNDKGHYYKIMNGEIAGELYNITEDDDSIGLTRLDSGSRSSYTANAPIRVPADLKGLKIRTMDSQVVIDMMDALGGSAIVMSYSEICAGLQQGITDGAENNITALRDHSDVTKYYRYDEYTRIPDVIVVSTKVWNQMSDSQKDITKETVAAATDEYKAHWADLESKAKTATEGNGITFVEDVDTTAFQEACQSIYDGLKTSNAEVYAIAEKIQAAGRQEPAGCCCLLRKGDEILKKLNDFLDTVVRFIMVVVMFTLSVGGTWQTFTRWTLKNPSTFTDEFLRYALIRASILDSAYYFYKDEHPTLDSVKDCVKGSVRSVLMIFTEAAILFFVCYVFIYGGIQLAGNAINKSSVMRTPFRLLYACLPISDILTVIACVIKYIQLFTDSKGGR